MYQNNSNNSLDYNKYMTKGKKGQLPENDSDLKPYNEWLAGKEHCDYNNLEKHSNRWILQVILYL